MFVVVSLSSDETCRDNYGIKEITLSCICRVDSSVLDDGIFLIPKNLILWGTCFGMLENTLVHGFRFLSQS